MTLFLKKLNRIDVHPDGTFDSDHASLLAPGNYHLKIDSFGILYLETTGEFSLPTKLYSDVVSLGNRIYKTFVDRKNNTGVLLTGEKGSGKTMLAKYLCLKAKNDKIPTIIVDQNFGPKIISFIKSIAQPCVVFFDEFEKVFKNDSDNGGENYQESLLTLLDGVFETKKLFLLTCNKEQLIDENMVNRPGRIYYLKRFQGLEMDFVKEYFEDNLNNKSLINDLLIKIALISPVNFDSLKAIVEECNRYEDIPDIRDILNLLNVGQNINATYVCYIALPGEDEWHRIGTIANIMSSKVILYSVNKIVDTLDKSKFSNHHVLSNTDIASDDDDYHDDVDPNEVNLSNINEALVKYKKFIKNLNEEDKINLVRNGHAFHKSDIKHIDLSGDIIFENSQGFKLKAEKMNYSSNGYRDFL